jgi:hypothetical protein
LTYLESLQNAVQQAHGCIVKHLESVPIRETFQGKTVWDGTVEVFALIDHPKTKRAYAWGYPEKGELEIVTVLGLPPIKTPLDAVRASIAGRPGYGLKSISQKS